MIFIFIYFYIKVSNVTPQFVVAAITGYFHSIACAANANGVGGSLQDILRFSHCGSTMDLLQKFKWFYRISFLFSKYYYFGFLQFLANQTEFHSNSFLALRVNLF